MLSMFRSWLRSWLGISDLAEDVHSLDKSEVLARSHLLQECNKAISEARQHGDEQSLALARRIAALDRRVLSIEGTERVKRLKLDEEGPTLPGFQ